MAKCRRCLINKHREMISHSTLACLQLPSSKHRQCIYSGDNLGMFPNPAKSQKEVRECENETMKSSCGWMTMSCGI